MADKEYKKICTIGDYALIRSTRNSPYPIWISYIKNDNAWVLAYNRSSGQDEYKNNVRFKVSIPDKLMFLYNCMKSKL